MLTNDRTKPNRGLQRILRRRLRWVFLLKDLLNFPIRFRMLENDFPEIYISVDGIFKTYQDTYSIPITKQSCALIKNEIKNIIRNGNLAKEFKETLSKL